MRLATLVLVAFAGVLARRGTAHAQYNVPSQATGESASLELADRDDQQIATSPAKTSLGWELGASLDFLTTTEAALGDQKLEVTDVVLFRVHGLVAIGRRGELFGGVDLLPKQPSYTDEHRWQGALAGGRVRFTSELSAYARGQLGPNLDHDGFWGIGEAALQWKRHLAEKVVFWETTVGGSYTHLVFDDADPVFQTDLVTQTGLAIREHRGRFATWLNFGFQFPLVASDALDPQVRVGMYFGMLVGVNKGLDLFVEGSILDRGDLEDPATTLPILSGGFDQRRILFGFNRRFGSRRR